MLAALGGVDQAAETDQLLVAVVEGVAEGGFGAEVVDGGESGVPKLGFAGAEAAELPFVRDHGIDQSALVGGGGMVELDVLGDQGFEVGEVFAADDESLGVDARFEGILAGGGLTLLGTWAGGTLRVGAIGCDLFRSCHKKSFSKQGWQPAHIWGSARNPP